MNPFKYIARLFDSTDEVNPQPPIHNTPPTKVEVSMPPVQPPKPELKDPPAPPPELSCEVKGLIKIILDDRVPFEERHEVNYTIYSCNTYDKYIIITQYWSGYYNIEVNIKTLDDLLTKYDRESILKAISTRRNNAVLAAKQKQVLEDKAILDKLAQIGCEK